MLVTPTGYEASPWPAAARPRLNDPPRGRSELMSAVTRAKTGPVAAEPGPQNRSLAWGLVREARPKQWAKNVLLFAAPGAAGVMGEADVLVDVLLGVLA